MTRAVLGNLLQSVMSASVSEGAERRPRLLAAVSYCLPGIPGVRVRVPRVPRDDGGNWQDEGASQIAGTQSGRTLFCPGASEDQSIVQTTTLGDRQGRARGLWIPETELGPKISCASERSASACVQRISRMKSRPGSLPSQTRHGLALLAATVMQRDAAKLEHPPPISCCEVITRRTHGQGQDYGFEEGASPGSPG